MSVYVDQPGEMLRTSLFFALTPRLGMVFRKPLKITGRTSSITNSFVQAIIPHISPSRAEIDEALAILDMSYDKRVCVYCGTPATDWDHLRPIVRSKRSTGFIDEIRNLVPSCGPCNQSKGAREWHLWMEGPARGSPKTNGVVDIDERIARLERFEQWGNLKPLPLCELAGAKLWDAHWANLEAMEDQMKTAQLHAAELRAAIQASLDTAI